MPMPSPILVLPVILFAVAAGAQTASDFTKQLKSKESADRLRAANELGKLGGGGASAVGALGAALADPVPEVRKAAANALGKMGKPAVAVLSKALNDSDRRESALLATGQLGVLSVELLPVITKMWKGGAVDGRLIESSLVAVGEPAVPHLIDCLQDHGINLSVCDVLGTLGPKAKPAVPALMALLEKKGVRGAEGAAAALGKIGDVRAVPTLVAVVERSFGKIESTTDTICHNAVRSLGELRSEAGTVVPLLLRVLAHARRDPEWCRTQTWALSGIERFDVRTPEVLAGIRALLAVDPGENKGAAEQLLKKFGG